MQNSNNKKSENNKNADQKIQNEKSKQQQQNKQAPNKKSLNNHQIYTLMQCGMNGIDFQLMHDESHISKITEIVEGICFKVVK